MKPYKIIIAAILINFFSGFNSYSQTVRVFVDTFDPSLPIINPEQAKINTAYTNAGFATVDITVGNIDATVTTTNYDVLIIAEFYNIVTDTPVFLTAAQRDVVESFITNGGHVVWLAESWDTYVFSGSPAPENSNAITTINNIYGASLAYGAYFSNGGMGSPLMPRTHPSNGPGGLSQAISLDGSGSYATLLNVPECNKVYSPDSFDGMTNFDDCESTVMALFPEKPISTEGSVIISTELLSPFSADDPMTGPSANNTQFNDNIAILHFNLLTGVDMTSINSWADTSSNSNSDCPCAAPAINVVGVNPDNCDGDNGSLVISGLTASTTYNVTYTVGGSTVVGPTSYTSNASGEITINNLQEGQYTSITVNDGTTNTVLTNTVNLVDQGGDYPVLDQIIGELVICDGASTTLTVQTSETGLNYQWQLDGVDISGETSAVITVSQTGEYTIVATNSAPCSSMLSVTVSSSSATVNPIVGDTTLCIGSSNILSVSSEDSSTTFQWLLDGVDISEATSSTYEASEIGEYSVVATNSDECTATVSVTLTEESCVIPNAISPNNDGKNDFFEVAWLVVKNIQIFNRYGTKVYEKDNYTNEFEGLSDNKKELPDGTYFYSMQTEERGELTGWIYIIRER